MLQRALLPAHCLMTAVRELTVAGGRLSPSLSAPFDALSPHAACNRELVSACRTTLSDCEQTVKHFFGAVPGHRTRTSNRLIDVLSQLH